MQRYKIILVLFCVIAPGLAARAQQAQEAGPSELRSSVEFLCDTLCRGRGTGTAGIQEAAFYIFRQFVSAGLDTRVHSFDAAGRAGHNIVAASNNYAPGAPVILVIAYYDALGEIGGKVLPGADANASGVAALLSLARVLGTSPTAQGKNLVFAALDAHNRGMAGAEALSRELRPSLVVNLDTVGSTLAPVTRGLGNYLIALGGGLYASTLEQADVRSEMHFYYDYYRSPRFTELFYRSISDHKFWLEAGVPCIMFTSGITMNTNREDDNADSLDYDILSKRVNIIARWLKAR